jgi:hypothetical protein
LRGGACIPPETLDMVYLGILVTYVEDTCMEEIDRVTWRAYSIQNARRVYQGLLLLYLVNFYSGLPLLQISWQTYSDIDIDARLTFK